MKELYDKIPLETFRRCNDSDRILIRNVIVYMKE
jgi:hypothetical protein